MPIMEWDSSLDIGVDAMNDEHKDILEAMNRIHDAAQAGRTGDDINRLVARLGDVCVRHFHDEEAYMASIGFPDLKIHALVHKDLLDRFSGHAAEIKAAGGQVEQGFFHFLRYWLRAHIKGIDRKYGEHAAAASKAA
jgi:hemerythrin-like metal-binding protein